MIGFDEASALEGSGCQSVVGKGVDVAHQAARGGEDGLESGLGEQGTIGTGQAEAVLEVEAGGVAVEAGQGISDADALGEGLEMSEAKRVTQAGLTDEEEGEAVLSIPVEVGQKGQESEQIGSQVMSLVDHKQDREMTFLDEPDDLLLDGAEAESPRPVGLQAELEGELAKEVGGVDGGVVQVDGTDLLGVKGVA